MKGPDRTEQGTPMKPGKDEKIILASGSPRRRAMMEYFGVPFEVIPSELSEFFAEGEGPVARAGHGPQKGLHAQPQAARPLHSRRGYDGAGGQTLSGQAQGPGRRRAHAQNAQRPRPSRLYGRVPAPPDGSELYDASITRVAFITLPDVLIERYVDTGEPMDKAGGYALQGIAGAFVSRIEGSPTGVIGLPLAMVTQLLWQAGFDIPLRSESEIRDWYDSKYAANAAGRNGD